ncbi:unnamed protein product [Ectocarpus sp. 12 AP-2014]
MEERCPLSPPRARETSASGRGVLTPQPPNSPPPRRRREDNDAQRTPAKTSGKRTRGPSFDGKSDSGGAGHPRAQTPTTVPTKVKNGLAFFRGAANVQTFSETERRHIESRLMFQRAYDSVGILSNGKPVDGGIDLEKAPVLAGVIDELTDLVGVSPDCVHMTTREGGQIHTSHSDMMKFDARSTVHLGRDVLLDGQVDPAKSTGDFVLSGRDLSQPLILQMRSGDVYVATDNVLHTPYFHGIRAPDQASLSLACTWHRVFHPFRPKSRPLAETFSSLCGMNAVDGE